MDYHSAPPQPVIRMKHSPGPVPLPAATARTDGRGLAAAATAFLIWGLMPLYLKALQSVPVLQLTAHRLVWGCAVAFAWLAVRREIGAVWTALSDSNTRWRLCASATLISVNWITYVWGIASNRVVETSLGYFINPLVNVVLGVVVLRERLNVAQWGAVGIAAAGVSYLAWSAGHPPWISLTLAFSFALYGLVRKVVQVDALAGFASETLLLVPIGLGYLVWCEFAGTGFAGQASIGMNLLLMIGGPVTAIPLVLFAYGARAPDPVFDRRPAAVHRPVDPAPARGAGLPRAVRRHARGGLRDDLGRAGPLRLRRRLAQSQGSRAAGLAPRALRGCSAWGSGSAVASRVLCLRFRLCGDRADRHGRPCIRNLDRRADRDFWHGPRARSNCVVRQAVACNAGFQALWSRAIALRSVRSLRVQAMSASCLGLPAFSKRW